MHTPRALLVARVGEKVDGMPLSHAAMKTRLGRPVSLKRTGVFFPYIGLLHGLWRVPTANYHWNYVIEGHTKNNWWVKVVVRVDFNWPTPAAGESPDNKLFPFVSDDRAATSKGFTYAEAADEDTSNWPKKSSFDLLRRAFEHFPKEPVKATVEELLEFFRGSVSGAVVTILGELTLDDFVSQQESVEIAIKVMALSQKGDPFVDCGISPSCLNIKVLKVEPITEGAKLTLEAQQRAENQGKAHETKAKHEQEAATNEAKRIAALVEAYKGDGEDDTTAAVLASAQVKGEDLSLEKLMMLSIIKREKPRTVEAYIAQRGRRRRNE